jgi:hypothetical protein
VHRGGTAVKKWMILTGLALLFVIGAFSSSSAQYCYTRRGGDCVSNGAKGRDSTCSYRCIIGVRNGKKVALIYKDHRWQVEPTK